MAGPNLAALIESQLPDFVVEDYPLVTNFLSKYYEALSISEGPQDIINNFEKYLDVDTFSPEVLVKTANLQIEIPLGTAKIDITVDTTDGFPSKNGMIMIDQEIFLYSTKTKTKFLNCIRGYSAKTNVGDLYSPVKYLDSAAAEHKAYAKVNNLSNLLLAALIKNYEEQYTSGFPYPYLKDETNKNLLVKKIKDFYNVKGTPQSLEFIFQMLFSVKPDIIYPKENVFKNSESGWNSKELLVVEVISGDIRKIVGNEIRQTPDPYNPELTAATAIIDNIVGEPYQGTLQYTLTISPGSKKGTFAIARRSFLMNDLSVNAGEGDRIDVFSTVGFPARDGRVVIGNEEITYSTKTATQFIIKERDAVNTDNKQNYSHSKGVRCFTKNNLSGFYLDNGVEREVELRIYGLVSGLAASGIEPEASAGLEYDETAESYFDVAAGGIPYVSFNNMVEFKDSGFQDALPLSNEWIINQDHSKLSAAVPNNVGTNNIKDKILSDVTAIYRDSKNYYIASSGFPSYAVGPFDNTATPEDQEHLKILPRKPINASAKQITTSNEVGLFVNGVSLLNHKSSNGLDFGKVTKINIIDGGRNYSVPPTVIVDGDATATAEINGIGEVTAVTVTNTGSGYTSTPDVTFTSGSGGQFTVLVSQGQIENIYLSIDQNAQIIDAGSNYTEAPDVFISDSSGKGKGAFFTCQIDPTAGVIIGFTKQSGGFDYQEATTTITLLSRARSATATAELTRWQYNKYLEMSVDNGNAAGVVDNANDPAYGFAYGHIIAPTSLKIQRQDNVDGQGNPLTNKSHSPILGWAYDGNPIYGSFGYDDPYQDVTAANPTIKRMESSWRIKTTRGSDAPSETTYSLGRFTNDFEFVERLGDLDANNGRFCTTPEFPNGVYAYFMTSDSNEAPTFPYSIGEAFYNVPVEENWKSKSRQSELPSGVRRKIVNASEGVGELLTSRISGIEYGPITNVEVHQSSYNFTNEDVLYVDNSINDNGDGLFAAVDQIQGQTVASLSCNTPKNNYFTCDTNIFLNHNATITQPFTGATATVIGLIEESDKFVVKNVTGTFDLVNTIQSDTEIYNLTFDNTVVASVGDKVIYQVQDGGVAHEAAIGKVLRNVFDKNTVIVELQPANPSLLTSTDNQGNTITLPSDQYVDIGYFATGNGIALGSDAATIVNVKSLSKGFKLLDIEDNIAVLRTSVEKHGLAVGDEVIVTVEPNAAIATQTYAVETKKYHTVQLQEPTKTTSINGSGVARLQLVNSGQGFTADATFQAVTLTSTSGSGTAATVDVTTDSSGRVASFTIASKGDGYKYGDTLTVTPAQLGGNVGAQLCTFFVDAAGCAKNDTVITVLNSTGIAQGDILKITDEMVQVTNVTGQYLTVSRGVNGSEADDHIEGVSVELRSNFYRFTKDANISFSNNTAYIDSYDADTHKLIVYYTNEIDTEIDATSTFLDGSTPARQVAITSVEPTDLRFRFKKDGTLEWFRNISLDVQKTYRYVFDTSDASLVDRNLKFYENVYRTTELVQAFESVEKPGNSDSYTSFQLGYGIPIDGVTWNSTPVLDSPTKIYYGEVSNKINSEDQFFSLVEDPFAGKHAVFYGYEYEFAYRLNSVPQNEGFTNVQYYTDSLYAVGAIKRVKVISGGKNYTMPPQIPGVFLNKRFRGDFTPVIESGRITSVTVGNTGLNYSKPVVLLENEGDGVNAEFNIELRADGSVSRIIPTNEGSLYDENTTLRLYESDVKLFAHGEDIGKLATLEIISSGKDFNNDPTLIPQVNPPIVMTLKDMPDKAFLNGELITQRSAGGDLLASGRVDYWIDGMNILRLKGLFGKFVQDRPLYGATLRSTANIQKIFVANITPEIGPTSTSVGSYGSDRSKLSAISQKIQDGVYYQDYSYVVKSTVSINDWRDFVKTFTHPAGFNLFGEVLIESDGDGTQPETIDTPQSGIKDNGFGAVMSILEPGVLGVQSAHKSRRITQSHVRVDSFEKQRGQGTINYSEQNNVEIEVFDLDISPDFDGAVQVDGTITGTKTFTLFKKDINEILSPYRAQQLLVTLDGVLQDPDTAYTISGSTITFAEAPLGPYTDPSTGIFVPGVTFYGKSLRFQDDANNARYMLESNNITSLFDGTTTEFDLGIEIVEGDHMFISLDGVIQEPDVAFTLTTNPGNGKVTFTEPPRQVGKIVELEIGDATDWLVNDFVVGQTTGARGEIVSKRYFQDDRFLDASNIIEDNSAVLAEEAVGILDDTSKFSSEYFTYPGLGRNQCIVDLKSVLKAMANDLSLGGNSNVYDAAKEYLLDPASTTSDIKHIEGEVEATLWAMKYLKDMTIMSVRNKFGIDNLYGYQRAAAAVFNLTPTNATYSAATGNLVLTIPDHDLTTSSYIAIATNALTFTCNMDANGSNHTYPRVGDPAHNTVLPVTAITDNTVTVDVGASPIVNYTPTDATYDPATGLMELTIGSHKLSSGTSIKLVNDSISFTCEMDDRATVHTYPRSTDPVSDTAINIVSTGTTSHTATNASYTPVTGVMNITVPDHGFNDGDKIKIVDNSFTFTCEMDNKYGNHTYPRSTDPASDTWLEISGKTNDSFNVNVGTTNLKNHNVSSATYNPVTGDLSLNIGNHTLTSGTSIKIADNSLMFTCAQDDHYTVHSYPRATDPYHNEPITITGTTSDSITVNVGTTQNAGYTPQTASYDPTTGLMDITIGNHTFREPEQLTPTFATYNAGTGIMEVTVAGHEMSVGDRVKFAANSLTFECEMDGQQSQKTYPRASDPWVDQWMPISEVTTDTFKVFVGSSPLKTFDVSAATYDPNTGDLELTIGTHGLVQNDSIKLAADSLTFTCDFNGDGNTTNKTYPRATGSAATGTGGSDYVYNTAIPITGVTATTIIVNVNGGQGAITDTTGHNFVSATAGAVITGGNYTHHFSSASANAITKAGESLRIVEDGISFQCAMDGNTATKAYPRGDIDTHTATDAVYDPATGVITITTFSDHRMDNGDWIKLADDSLTFTCQQDNDATNHSYPRATDPISGKWIQIFDAVEVTNQFSIRVLDSVPSTNTTIHTFVSATANGISQKRDRAFEAALPVESVGSSIHTVENAAYDPVTGIMTITITGHSFANGNYVKLEKECLTFNCTKNSGATTHSYPRSTDPTYKDWLVISNIQTDTFDVNVGISGPNDVYAHTFVPGAENTNCLKRQTGVVTVDVGESPIKEFTPGAGTTYDPVSGDLVLAIGPHSLAVGTAIKIATNSLTFECDNGGVSTGVYPRPSGANTGNGEDYAYDTSLAITAVSANSITVNVNGGQGTISHNYPHTFVSSLAGAVKTGGNYAHTFSSALVGAVIQGGNYAHTFVSANPNAVVSGGNYAHEYVTAAANGIILEKGKITLNVGASPLVNHDVTNATYDPQTGDVVLTIGAHSLTTGESIKLKENALTFTCAQGSGNYSYPRSDVESLTATTGTTYNPTTGVMQITTTAAHNLVNGDWVKFAANSLTFSCAFGGTPTDKTYPRSTDYPNDRWLQISNVTADTFEVTVLDVIPSTNTDAHTFVSATADGISAKKDPYFDTAIPITGTSTTTITINILKSAPSTNTTVHTFVSALPGAVISGGNYAHTFKSATADAVISGGAYDHTFVSATSNSIGVYNDPYRVSNPVANTFIDAAGLLNSNKTFIAKESVARMVAANGTIPDPVYKDSVYIKYEGTPFTATTGTTYDPSTGIMSVTTTVAHGLSNNDWIKFVDGAVTFKCAHDGNQTNHAYPRSSDPVAGKWLEVSNVTSTTFQVQVLDAVPSTNETAHTFVSGLTNGIIRKDGYITLNVGKSSNTSAHTFVPQVGKTPTNATYNPNTGVMNLVVPDHGWDEGDWIQLADNAITFTCQQGAGNHSYPRPITNTFTATGPTSYDPSTGVLSITTTTAHGFANGDWIKLADNSLTFECDQDGRGTQHSYPRYGDPISDTWLEVTVVDNDTFNVNCLEIIPSTNVTTHYFMSATADGITHKVDPASGGWLQITNVTPDYFDVQVNTTVPSSNTTTHTFVSAAANSVKRAALVTGGAYVHTFDRALTGAVNANTGAQITPTGVAYDPATGDMVITKTGHNLTTSNTVSFDPLSIILRCEMDQNASPHAYPRPTDPVAGRDLVIKAADADTFTVFVGKSLAQPFEPSAATYDPATGDMVLNIGAHKLGRGTGIRFATDSVAFTCAMDGGNAVKTYPRASSGDAHDDCVDDVVDILDGIIFNLKYGGNNRVWDAADLYVDRSGFLEHITQQVSQVLTVFSEVKDITKDVIRNDAVNIVGTHGLTQIVNTSITLETGQCAVVEQAINTFVQIVETAVQNPSTFEASVTRTLPELWPIEHSTLVANRDTTITVDSNPQCAQVESAINTLFSIVTTTIQEAYYNNNNYLLQLSQDFPNPNRIQVEMSKKEFVAGEDIQSEATLNTIGVTSTTVVAPGVQQKYFGFKQGKYYKLDSIESQFNDAQTIFELERGGVPFYAERNQNIVVILNGVIQVNQVAYRIEDNIIVFTEPPSTGSACFILYFYGLDPERVLLGYNIESPGTFKKFFRLTVDQQIVLPVEGADCWVSTDPQSNPHTYVNSYSRGRIYKQSWTPGQQNLLFVEGVTAQKANWLNGTLSITRDRGASPSILDVTINAVEEIVDSDLREKLFNRNDRFESNLNPGDLIQIDGEADTRSIIRAAREALVTSGYDSDTSGAVGSFFRSYEYEVVINVGAYSGQIEGQGAQAVARIDAELRFHTLTSSRSAGLEFLPGDTVVQYADQNDTSSAIVWSAEVKNYVPERKTIELKSLYIDGGANTDPVAANFRPGEKVYIDGVVGTEATALQYLKPGGVNSIVLSKRDNSTYFDNINAWRQDNVLNKGQNLLGGAFVPNNASASDVSQEYDFSSSLFSSDLQSQISKNYREPPRMIFRSQPLVDSNGDAVGSPTGGGARANAIVVRGEVADTEIITTGSGYKVPPQILFTRGYFVIRKDSLDITTLTTFGVEPVTIDGSSTLKSFLTAIKKGGSGVPFAQFASYMPLGDTLVFGNGGSPAYRINRSYDGTIIWHKVIDASIEVKPQPEIYVNLSPEQTLVSYQGTKVTNTQCTGGVQGISVAMTKYKNTETKLSCNAGAVEKQAGNNPQMIGNVSYSAGNLGPHLNFLQNFKFEIQPQSLSSSGLAGSYTDGQGRTINYVMGDMTIGFFSDRYPNLTVGDFENPEVYNSQVNDPGDTNNFVFQQGSEIHFGTTLKYAALDNPIGADILLVESTAGFPASGGSVILGSGADQTKVEKLTYTQALPGRLVGCTRVNPIGVVEKGFNTYDMDIQTFVGTAKVSTGTGSGGTTNGFLSNINYVAFGGVNMSTPREATFGALDLTTYSTVTFSAIRGNGSNGGDAPAASANDLLARYSIDGGTTFVDIGTIVAFDDTSFDTWNTVSLTIPSAAQTATTILQVYQAAATSTNTDAFGVRFMWFDDANTDSYIAGDYVITADLDL